MGTSAQKIPPDPQQLTPEVMADAKTVVLIVHGIGDHTQTNILDSFEHGLALTLPAGSFTTTRLRLSKVLLPSGSLGNAEVTRIQTSGVERFVIPVIWSRQHLRAEGEIAYIPRLGSSSVQYLTLLMARAARPLFALCMNSFRCIPKSTGAWKAALTAVSFLVLFLEVVGTLGLLLALAFLPYIYPVLTGIGRKSWGYIIAVAIIPLIVLFLFKKSVVVYDLIGDVVFYVGRPDKRSEIEATMLRIINWTQEQAPHADIIVAAHSLGSVLVTHSLLRDVKPRSSRFLLVTLGSPLPTMSRVFSRYVVRPDELLKRFGNAGSVSFWLHLWRDADWIGRSLHAAPNERFAEASVGDGLHPNYWSDSRVSKKVVEFMQASDSGTVAELVSGWSTADFTESETQEFRRRYGVLQWMPWLASVSLAMLYLTGGQVFSSAYAAGVKWWPLFAVRALLVASVIFLLPFSLTRFVTNPRKITLGNFLGRLRFAFSLYSICFKLSVLFCVMFFIARWLARSP
jgi:hypothetical protein